MQHAKVAVVEEDLKKARQCPHMPGVSKRMGRQSDLMRRKCSGPSGARSESRHSQHPSQCSVGTRSTHTTVCRSDTCAGVLMGSEAEDSALTVT